MPTAYVMSCIVPLRYNEEMKAPFKTTYCTITALKQWNYSYF